MEYQRITNQLDTKFDKVPRFIIKSGLRFIISLVVLKI